MNNPSHPPPASGLPSWGLLLIALLCTALDVGVARITYGVALPAFTRDLNLSFTVAGALGTLHLIGYLVGTLLSPALSRRIDATRLCRISHAAFGVGMVISGLATGPLTLAFGRIVAGLAAGFGIFSLFVIVFAATVPHRRAIAGSLAWSGIGVAIVLSGAISAPLLATGGAWRWSFLAPAAVAFAVAVFLRAPKPTAAQAAAGGAKPPGALSAPNALSAPDALSAKWLFLFASYFMFAAAYIAYSTFAGAQLKALAVSPATTSLFWIAFGLSSIAGSALGAVMLSHARLRDFALFAALASGAIGAVLVVFGNTASLFAAALLVGLGLVATPAITTILVRLRTTDASYPAMFTLATASLGAGQLLGPFVAGALADHFGPMAVGLFSAAIYAVGAALAACDGVVSRAAANDKRL